MEQDMKLLYNSITPEDIQKFYGTWIRPNNATLVIVGDIQITELVAKLESKLAGWKKGDVPKKNIATAKNAPGKRIYLINRPESTQSVIFARYLTVPYGRFPSLH